MLLVSIPQSYHILELSIHLVKRVQNLVNLPVLFDPLLIARRQRVSLVTDSVFESAIVSYSVERDLRFGADYGVFKA